MYIEKLKLKNYRNYEEVEINFNPKVNIIYGNNAVGKTNLLESIYLCSTSKSHRNTKENDIINFNKDEAHIKLIFKVGVNVNSVGVNKNPVGANINPVGVNINPVGANACGAHVGASSASPQVIDIQLNKDLKKGVAKNGIKVDKLSDFLGFFNVILFAPEDLNIIKDGPIVRRKFLDILISQIDKIYVQQIQNYNKTLNQRNALLKDIYKESGNNREYLIEMLDTYDEQLVNYGIEVIKKRQENIKKLAEKILRIHSLISDNKEKLIIAYENDVLNDIVKPVGANANLVGANACGALNIGENAIPVGANACGALNIGASSASPKEIYLKKLKDTRDLDIKNQYTLVGPHRDDISFVIDGNDIRKFGSQGQKKTAAISLKLSELEMIKEKINDTPVLLLDDVFSELDETRQKLLVSNLKDIQTIITCTGIKKNIFDLLKPEKIFNVVNNKIIDKTNL